MDVSFTQIGSFSGVDGEAGVLSAPTSLQFGPDGRLYVSEQNGTINAFTIELIDGEYVATAHEEIQLPNGFGVITHIENHNDNGFTNSEDGSNAWQFSNRQVTGLVVAGTADAPVLYITSSDPRISSGSNESNLDTNSGVLTRVTLDPVTGEWDAVDLIRGLPRSEENHSNNGLQLSADGNSLYVMVGGHTNNGAPSNFFGNTTEYTLSGAMLEVDLVALDAMPILIDPNGGQPLPGNNGPNGIQSARQYVYDLPTLDDPNRENAPEFITQEHINELGLDQSQLGDTLTNDLALALGFQENFQGLDTNGPWGGNDGLNQAVLPADAPIRIFADGFRNPYDVVLTENGRFYSFDNGSNGNLGGDPLFVDGEATNAIVNGGSGDGDSLSLIVEGGYYGHANPTRSNQDGSLTTVDENGSRLIDSVSDLSDGVSDALAIADGYLIDPSRFAALDGLTPAEIDARLIQSGTRVTSNDANSTAIHTIGSSTNGITEYTGSAFDSALAGGLVTVSQNGTVTFVNLNADGTALEPLFGPGDDGILGTADDVEISSSGVFTIASGQAFPLDVTMGPDGTIFVANVGGGITVFAPSDLVLPDDPDFDNDDIDNIDDAFSRDATNGASVFAQPGGTLVFDFDANADGNLPGPNGIAAGLTGMAVNGVMDYEDFLLTESTRPGQDIQADNVKFQTAAGGGTNVIEFVSNGNASGTANDGEFLFQTGVTIAPTVETFVASWSVFNPGLGGFAGPGDINGGGFTEGADQEIGGFLGTGDQSNFLKLVATEDSVEGPGFLFELENGDVVLASQFIAAADLFAGQPVGQNQIELSIEVDIEAETATPTITYETPAGESVTLTGTAMSLAGSNVMTAIEGDHMIQGESSGLALGLWSTNGTAQEADAFQAIFDEISLTSDGDASRVVLHRVNTGGEEVAAIDGGPNWTADTNANPSVFRVTDNGASNSTDGFGVTPGASVPATTPDEIYEIGRFDQSGGGSLQYIFPDLEDGTYEVTLFLGNGYGPASAVGARIFDVSLEGSVPTEFDDIDPVALFGNDTGGALTTYVEVIDGALNIEFLHGVENPNPFGIEIARIGGEEAITVDVVSGTQIVAEDAAGPALISLLTSETVPVGEAVTVTFELASGSATAGEDFSIDLPGVTLTNGVYTGTLTIAGGSSDVQLSVDILDDLVSEMDEAFTFTITGTSGNAEIGNASATVTIEDNDGPAGDIVLAINAGGPALTQDGIDFVAGSAANFFTGGSNFSDGGAGNGEQAAFDGTVFETEVFGGAGASVLSFETDLAPGEYTVELYFAEIFLPNPGNGADTRIFDVSVEGELVIDDLNILEANGGDINGTIVQLLPQIFTPGLDGVLTIDLDGIVDNAKISGIVIREVDGNDSAAPVATIEVALPEVDTDDLVATVTFDEPVIGLESADVTLTSPTLGDRADGVVDMAADGLSATVTFTAPIEGFANGDYGVALSAGGVVDLAGNDVAATNSGAATLTLALDINEVYDENVNGDLSDDGLNPTDLAPLMVGSNIVTLASTDANGDDASTGSDRDYFTIEVPEGHELSQVVLNNYAAGGFAGNLAYLALSDEDTINVDPAATEEPTDSNLIGGTLVGDSQEGADILQLLGGGFSGSGFSGPLPAGTYTFWLNQNASTSTLSLDFVIEEVQVALVRGDLLSAINAGGPSLTQDGILFEANTAVEAPFEGSVIFSDGGGGNGNQPGLDGTVFETERNGNSDGDFTFALPVTSQQVFVDLYLAELFQSAEGVRIMDVYVEGELVLDDFDIYAALMEGVDQSDPAAVTAALNEGLVISLPNPVDVGANGTLDISFDGISDRGTVSGITVYEAVEDPGDVTAPIATLDITPAADALSPVVVAVTFDEPVTDLDASEVTLSGPDGDRADGVLDMAADGLSATVTFAAPAEGFTDGEYSAAIVAGAVQDAAANGNAAATTDAPVTFDFTPPTVTMTFEQTTTDEPLVVELTFSEPIEGLDVTDLLLANQNYSAQPDSVVLAADGLSGTATFVPPAGGFPEGVQAEAYDLTFVQDGVVDLAGLGNAAAGSIVELFDPADQEGRTELAVNIGSADLFGDSTFGANSIQISNVGQLEVVSITIDLGSTLIPQIVFDPSTDPVTGEPLPPAGDTANKDFDFGGASIGLIEGDVTVNYGDGQSPGFNQMLLTFEAGSFTTGDLLSFSIDIDPDSAYSPLGGGAVSGQELAGATFTVTYSDGSTATGTVAPEADATSGAVAVADTTQTLEAPTVTFADGSADPFITPDPDLPIVIDAGIENAGATVRVFVLESAFYDPDGNDLPVDFVGNNLNANAIAIDLVLDANGQFTGTIPVTRTDNLGTDQDGTNIGINTLAVAVLDANGDEGPFSTPLTVEHDPAHVVNGGRAEFGINIGSSDLFGDSTFFPNSMQITNTSASDNDIVSVTIDLANTLIPDIVFDPKFDPETGELLPPAGDSVNKDFEFGLNSLGLTEDDVTVSYGDGQSPGFNQIVLEFARGSFEVGDLLSFGIDIDPGSAYSPLGGGAVSGQELAGATFTVTYADGTTATGTVAPEADGTSGATAVAQAGQNLTAPTLTLADGTTDAITSADPDLPVIIDAGIENAGATARVFIQDTAYYTPDGSDAPEPYVGNNLNANTTAIDIVLDENGQFTGTLPITRTDNLGTDQDGTNIGINAIAVALLDENGDEGPFSNTLTVEHDPVTVLNAGRAELAINIGNTDLYGASTFFADSMQITNTSTGDTDIVSVTIDLANTLIPNTVFDPKFDPETGELLPPAGDSVNKDFEFGLASLGLTEDDVTVTYGDGQNPGFNQITLEFAAGSFEVGDLLSFGIDIDPDSAYSPLGGGAVSGQELAGATFTVTYSDGTTATGTVAPEADGTNGAVAVAQAGQDLATPTLTFADGTTDPFTSTDPDLPVIIDAGIENAGATVRVFIQDTAYYTPDGSAAPEAYVGNNLNAFTTAIDIVLDANGQYTGTLPITRTDNQNTAEDGNNIGINAIAVALLDENGDEGPFSDTLTVEFNEFFVPGFNSIVATEPFDILTGTDAADIFIFPAGTSDTAAIDVIKNIGPDDLIDLSRTGVEEGTLEVRTISGGSTIKLIQGFGADQFQLKVELNGLTAQQVLDAIIYANQVNEAPNAIDDASSTEEETSVVVNVLDNDTDPNNDVLGVDEFTQGANGTVVDLGNGNLQYTPNAGFIGQDTFDYTVADTEGLTDTATVTINVTEEGANLAPVAVDDTATTEQDTAVQVFVLNNDSDPDLDAITLDSVSNVAGGQAVIVDDGINPAFVQFTPDAGFVGTASFDYVISDADGLTAAATATVTVNPVGGGVNIINATGPTETLFATSDPDIIVFEPGTSTTAALDIVQGYGADDQIDLSALGLEAGDLEVRLVGGGNILKLIEGFGSNDFQLKVELNGLSVQEVLDSIIYDAGVNTAPNAVADAATTIENQSVVVDVLDNDTDAQNDTLSVSAFTQGTNGAVIELPDGTLQYTPNPDFFGQDTFSYTVSDPDGLTDTEIVTITVNEQGVNTAPTAVADAASTIEEQSVIIDVIENDTDPENDALTIDVFSQGQNGVVSQDASGNLVYTPNANFVGTDTFTYTVSDTGGLTDQATVTVSVDEAGSFNVVNAGVGKETFVSTDDTDVYVFEAGTSVTGSIDVIEGYDPDDIIDVSALGIQPGDLEARVVSGGQTLKLIEGFGSGDFQLRIDLDDGLTVQQVLDSVVYADVPQAAESSVFGKSSPIMEDQPVEFQKDAVIPIMEDQPAEISKNVEVPIMEDQPIEFNSNLPAPFVLPIQEIGGSDGFGSWMSSLSDMDGPLANAITAPDSSVVPGVQINAPAKTAPVMEVQSADVTKAPATPIMEPQPTNEAAFASDAFDFTGLANVQLGGTDLFLAEQSFGASNAVIDRADAATGNLGGEFDAFNTNDDWMVELDQWIDYA